MKSNKCINSFSIEKLLGKDMELLRREHEQFRIWRSSSLLAFYNFNPNLQNVESIDLTRLVTRGKSDLAIKRRVLPRWPTTCMEDLVIIGYHR